MAPRDFASFAPCMQVWSGGGGGTYAESVMLRDATGDDASNADAALAARSRDVSTTSLNRMGSDRAKATNVGQGTCL
jgi:hypothetical protein